MSRKCDEWFEGVKRVPRRMSSRLYNWGVKGKRDGYIQTEGGLEEREDEYFLLSGGREEGSYLDVPDRYFSLREDERDALVERIIRMSLLWWTVPLRAFHRQRCLSLLLTIWKTQNKSRQLA